MTLPLEPATLPADAIEVGRILDAWGVQGWFKVMPYSASPEALFASKRWFLLPPEKGPRLPKAFDAFAGTVRLVVKEAKEHSDSIVARAEDVADRNAAESLRGARIFIARSSFPTPEQDEYYWVDLIGMEVVNREGLALGTVRDLQSTGPQTVLVVSYKTDDGKDAERMIPFVSAYVDGVDLQAKRITVDWQADYDA